MSPEYALIMTGSVQPPADLMAVSRMELSEAGFERLMQITGGNRPTPRQLVREVEFERHGHYLPEAAEVVDLERAKRALILGQIIAAAKIELSDAGFRELMTATNYEPTAQQLVAAVEAARG